MRLAWLSPLPPVASGIADYSFELLPFVAEGAGVDVVAPRPPGRRRRPRVPEGTRWIEPAEFEGRRNAYDAVLHHLGNNPHHGFVYEDAVSHPGIAVFHDAVLHHLISHMTVEGPRDPLRYRRLMEAEYGAAGGALARLRMQGVWTEFEKFLFPLSESVARGAKAMVTHSEYVRDRLADAAPEVPATVIPHFAPARPSSLAGVDRGEARRRLGLPWEAFLVGHLGFVTRPKQPAAVLGGFRRLLDERPDARLLLVGADHTGGAVRLLTERYGLEGRVGPTGFVELERFYLYLLALDAVVNLRYPSAGESSGTVARSLAEGRAVVMSDIAAFAEVPPDAALKVEVDGDQADQVGEHLLALAADPTGRMALERRARRYAETVLDRRRCAALYLQAARAAAERGHGGPPRRRPPIPSTSTARRPPPFREIRGAADPTDRVLAVAFREEVRPFVEWFVGQTLPPSGAGAALDMAYGLILRRPVEEPALRSALLQLAAGQATRADLIRWLVDSREFREIEFVERALADVRSHPGPFTLAPGHPGGPDTTERAVEIPWVLSRWSGEGRVLDLGYAYAAGYYLSAVAALGIPELHGVDWSAAAVPGMLRTRGDLRALPYRAGAFDLVLCISTIEHVGLDNARYGMGPNAGRSGDALVLREIERVLHPGGRLLITVPFGRAMDESWFVQYDRARWERLVGSSSLLETERDIFHLTEAGWVRTEDVKTAEELVYGAGAPAARAVLCAALTKA